LIAALMLHFHQPFQYFYLQLNILQVATLAGMLNGYHAAARAQQQAARSAAQMPFQPKMTAH